MTMQRKRKKIHGKTFLTKPRWYLNSTRKAQDSLWVWSARDPKSQFHTLSLLGVINGLLSKVKLVLVADTGRDDKVIHGYRLVRKWWLNK